MLRDGNFYEGWVVVVAHVEHPFSDTPVCDVA